MTGPGNHVPAALAERAAALLLRGRCCSWGRGRRQGRRAGDVVAADSVYDYETGKDTEAGFLPRQKTYPAGTDWSRSRGRWRWPTAGSGGSGRCRKGPPACPRQADRGGRPGHHPPRVGVGQAAGRDGGDVVAVDMEAYGFLTGAYLNQGSRRW
ncbi:hypothetical protein NKH77_03465 [Streptomyces sp. M19]